MTNDPPHPELSADCTMRAGCEDCPACRGELHAESSAMNDMRFAASALETDRAADSFWATLAVAQVVRDGIKARGEASPDDMRVLEFLGRVTKGAVRADTAAWDRQVGVSFDERPHHVPAVPWISMSWYEKQPDFSEVPSLKQRGARLKPMRSRRRKLAGTAVTPGWDPGRYVPLGPGVVPRRGKPLVPPLQAGARRCCVKKFSFPEFMQSTTRKTGKFSWHIGFEFWVYAEHEESAACACECCYYEQYAKRSDLKDAAFKQDCVWTDASGRKHSTVDEVPPEGAPVDCDDSQNSGGSVAGTTSDGETVGPGSEAKHWSQMHIVSSSESRCLHRYYDEPSQDRDFVIIADWDITWEYIGVVLDVCHDWRVVRAGWLTWQDSRDVWAAKPDVAWGHSQDEAGSLGMYKGPAPLPRGIKPEPKK